VVSFCYVDEGVLSTSGFESFLDRYRDLFRSLARVKLVYVAAGIVKLTTRRQSYLGDQPRLLRFNKHTSPSSIQRKLGLSAVDGGSL
jgi:hypothetical protein